MEPLAWLDDALTPVSRAAIGVYDLALLRGFGIYEGLAAHDGEPFRFADHYARFQSSAKALGLSIPLDEAAALEAMRAVVRANAPAGRATVRMLLTGGVADGGIVHVTGRERFFILAEPMKPYPAAWYETGATAVTHPHKRALPQYKTIDYIAAVNLQPKLAETKSAEVIYTHDGNVLECTGSNLFAVKDGTLVTPKDDVLFGITRKVTLEVAREAGIPVEERVLPLAELLDADEAFITSSFKDIVPLVAVDGSPIGSGSPGPVTRRLMQLFEGTHGNGLKSAHEYGRVAIERP